MLLDQWARAWGIPQEAMADLHGRLMAADVVQPGETEGRSETAVSNDLRLEASRKGKRLWRNNVGVLPDRNGRPVRYGLANDSPQVNRMLKSADLIGIDPVLILPEHVGTVIGRFLSVEAKREGKHGTDRDRADAQQAWALLVSKLGGRALIVNRAGEL